ncbi:Mur ligase family protein [Clostridiisalibacter paucivorans]|uniref:Mur ligase family protein n=1 Tax=Clostridiisalibacter paucivorans TaxID=408753 RepID=UPI00054EDE99|nr:UDP-N-acetylmuramyl-tripeptide synthetase [Clostridiisalibacter paucivorans]
MKVQNIKIQGVTGDSRKVKDGYAFVAIKGHKLDGNDFIHEAIDNGAVVVYTEKDISSQLANKYNACKFIKTENARKKLAELLNEYYGFPSKDIFLIGVTGTNGKTTTTNMIYHILEYNGFKPGLIGTTGIKYLNIRKITSLTTPGVEEIYELLNEFNLFGIKHVIIEVSSHGLKDYRTYGLEFDVAIHTNIDEDHMDFHQDFEEYIECKRRLFQWLPCDKMAILNCDDHNFIRLIEGMNNLNIFTYGLNKKATVTASSLVIDGGIEYNICIQRGINTVNGLELEPQEYPIKMKLLGKHNVYNSLAAISTALYLGISIEKIGSSLLSFKGIKRRLEFFCKKRFLAIDDFCHNPLGYESLFETIQNINCKEIIMINAIRGNRGIDINKKNAETIAWWASILKNIKIILTLSKDNVSDKDIVNKLELESYTATFNRENISYEIYENLEDAIKSVLEYISEDDLLLLTGSQGMDKGQEIFFKYNHNSF